MRRLSDSVHQNIKSLNAFKRRLEALIGTKAYAALLRGCLRAVNRDMVKRVGVNQALRGISKGKCFILGNGPSLKHQDLQVLQNENVFTCNYYCDFEQIGGSVPVAHFITDERILNGPNPPIIDTLSRCRSQGIKYLFLSTDLYESAQRHNLEEWFDVYYLMQGAPMVENVEYEIDGLIPSFETVVHSEILTAVYMGYSEIYLLGCDCTGFATFAQAYQSEIPAAVSDGYGMMISAEAERSIKTALTSRPIEEELRAYAGLFDSYAKLLTYCKAHDVKLFNATAGGVLESIPRVDLFSVK